ncbi:hypothetical protein Pan153_62310 [Gimesia panareensis]|uniref:Uncharacterized protein n=1 Tax=Gimesia panareensis TaxID=2527978 RepID=A0A518FYX8_9PLAN|nr:hypothetical protein Pan153_62310 [Gimesia panareensis]
MAAATGFFLQRGSDYPQLAKCRLFVRVVLSLFVSKRNMIMELIPELESWFKHCRASRQWHTAWEGDCAGSTLFLSGMALASGDISRVTKKYRRLAPCRSLVLVLFNGVGGMTKFCPKVAGICPGLSRNLSRSGLILSRLGACFLRIGSQKIDGSSVKIDGDSGAFESVVRCVPVLADPSRARARLGQTYGSV